MALMGMNVAGQSYDEWIDRSFAALDSARLDLAEEALLSAMRQEPDNPRNRLLLLNIGSIQRKAGKSREALDSYNLALQMDPTSQVLLRNRASLLGEMEKYVEAAFDYSKLLKNDPTNAELLYERAMVYIQLGELGKADEDLRLIVARDDDALLGRKGYAKLEMVRGNHLEAERIYSYLIEQEPHDPSFYVGRAELYYVTKRYSRAQADLTKAIHGLGYAHDGYLYLLRARIKMAQYDKTGAVKDLKRAQELDYPIGELEKLME